MWIWCFILSIACLMLSGALAAAVNLFRGNKGRKLSLFRMLFAGVFLAAFVMFLPVHLANQQSDVLRSVLMALFNAMQIFTLGTEYALVEAVLPCCDPWFSPYYGTWAVILFVLAPVFTFGFVLSLFKNMSAYLRYLLAYFKKMYVFSELNQRSLALATDIRSRDRKAGIVFNAVFEDSQEQSFELLLRARQLGAICFRKDILSVNYGRHTAGKEIAFFAIGGDETENLDQTLGLVELYKNRKNTHIYVFSTRIESELLLTAVDKGQVKVRRINEVQSLINRILYERGQLLFENALAAPDGVRDISAVLVGLGSHGTEMLKALSWYGQMDGYRIRLTAFDRDPLAEERLKARAPELLSPAYNGVFVPGEAQYSITVHPGCDVETADFAGRISALKQTTYVFVSLGDDDMNIRTAVNLRMLFARIGCKPTIQAVLTNSQQKRALEGIRNYRGQPYDIEFLGDIDSSYAEAVIIDSELEDEALQRHLKWGREEEFWAYEYNYRSSVASAIHLAARIKCGMPGAGKPEAELTDAQRDALEQLEHRRWNAYMRAEGYVYSGSPDKKTRNDLAKMHHDLVHFSVLSEEEKRKDSAVGSK